MKNKQYLEQIIRGYLTEASVSIIAKCIIAPEKIRAQAKSVGAEEAFISKLVVRGRNMPSEQQLYDNAINAISMHSQIGKNSKYANGNYVYVLSKDMRDSEKNFVYTGFIFSEATYDKLTSPESQTGKPDTVITATSTYHVGSSRLVTSKSFDQIVNSSAGGEVKAVEDVLNKTTATATTTSDAIDMTADTTNDVATAGDETSTNSTITYPWTDNGITYYTMSDTDPWVYAIDNGEWWTQKKSDFEAGKSGGTNISRNSAAVNKLNKAFPDAGGASTDTSSNTDGNIEDEIPADIDTVELAADVKAEKEAVEKVPGVVKGKLKNKFTLSIKSNPSGTAIQYFDLKPGSDLIFNPKTKTWLIYPKPEQAKNYGWHSFKYVMGSNVFTFAGKAPAHDRATWISPSLSKFLNSESYVNSLKSVYTAKDPVLQEELSKCLAIAKDLQLVTTTNPNKYFYKYRSTTDDNEAAASNWFKVAFNKAWSADLKKLKASKNQTIVNNADIINSVATDIYKYIKSGQQMKPYVLKITNPENKKVTNFNIQWNYM
jgi:hypothetical protein